MKTDDSRMPKKSAGKGGKNFKENKIELISCVNNGERCNNQLSAINENYIESDIYHQNKEYQKSIEALKHAFRETFELQDAPCASCAKMFRSTIIHSLENLHLELQSMSTGYFKTKKFKSSYILAGDALKDLRKEDDLR